MLTLLLGRAGSGKTAEILRRLSENVEKGVPGNIYIVPEQYSHDAEREMAEVCPDDACLYAEVLSFSRLEGRVFSEVGGLREKTLDKGGRLLSMMRAVTESAPYLKVYSLGSSKPDYLKSLISTYDELRSAEITVPELFAASKKVDSPTGEKLKDLSLIFESYERVKEQSGLDPRDRLSRLASGIAESSVGNSGEIFIDGFTDFTAQELRVIDELIKKGASITVSLTTADLMSEEPMFALPAKTGRTLMALASKRGVKCETQKLRAQNSAKAPELTYLEKNITGYGKEKYDGKCEAVSLYRGAEIYDELSLAAARTKELVRAGARYRQIAIVSPDWNKYASGARGILGKYSIPFNSSDKEDILNKPLIAFVLSALEVVITNWDRESVCRYIKTGLAGITADERDLLENYLIKWNVRGSSMWQRAEGWKMHPDGYSDNMSDEARERLQIVNSARLAVCGPLAFLEKALAAETGAGKAEAVYDFLEQAGIYGKTEEKVRELEAKGKLKSADELSQLWSIVTDALEQFSDIVGDKPMDNEEFSRLLRLLLGEYDVSTIPSSIDAVGVGDMSRMRGRGIKHLIIVGATDASMPSFRESGELFSEREKTELRNAGLGLPDSRDDDLSRELGLIYSALTMPSDSLTMSFPETTRKSYMVTRISEMFGIQEKDIDNSVFLYAREPALELAASAVSMDKNSLAARAYFSARPELKTELEKLQLAAKMPRGRLSRMAAEKLYGRNVTLSASRLDKFYSCRYSYFLKYGLRLKRRDPAGLDAPETGTFIHFVLEKTFSAAKEKGGVNSVSDDELRSLARGFCQEYALVKLGGLEDKTGRFKYLFSRLCDDAERIVLNMARELRSSSFSPLSFELRFGGDGGELPPIEVDGDGGKTRLIGVADRVDGWIHNDKLYIRVIDYKTGKKSFRLSDILYGMGMQMLIYLFALKDEGEELYKKEIVPAGVLYAPARDAITPVSGSDISDEELEAEKLKKSIRSGLLLNDPEVIDAMENGTKHKYIPVKLSKEGLPSGDSLAGAEELGALARHVFMLISGMGNELRQGELSADPYFRSQLDNACVYCDYFGACHFRSAGDEDRPRYVSRVKTPEAWEKIMRNRK